MLRTDPDWDTIHLALPAANMQARAALKHARLRYEDVLLQLEEQLEYEHRREASGGVGGQQQQNAGPPSASTSPSPDGVAAQAGSNTATVPAAAAATEEDADGTTATTAAGAMPRGVAEGMIPSTDVAPRPSHRLRATSFDPSSAASSQMRGASSQMSASGGGHGGSNLASPAPREPPQPPPAKHRADASSPLPFQRRPRLRYQRTQLVDHLQYQQQQRVRSPSAPPPQVLSGTTKTHPPRGSDSRIGFQLPSQRRQEHPYQAFAEECSSGAVSVVAREALLVVALAGTLFVVASRL